MDRDEIWERLKKDETKVYGQSMLDMFLKTTESLERRHWDGLSPAQRKLVKADIRLKYASTVEEAERAVKDGAEDFYNALDSAAEGGHLDVCRWLVEANPSEKGAMDFEYALLFAARGGHLDVCRWLVEKGARKFDLALDSAAEGGHLDVCKWLVEKGARNFNYALSHAPSREVRDYLLKAKEEHGKG